MVLENNHTLHVRSNENLRVWESKRLKLNWIYQRENKISPGKFSHVRFYLLLLIIIIIIYFFGGGSIIMTFLVVVVGGEVR